MHFMFEVFEDKLIQKCVFWRFGLNLSVFEKFLISYSCISFMKYYALRSFCIKLLVFQKIDFSRFSIDQICCSIDQSCDKNFGLILPCSIDARLMLDRLKLKNFQFLSICPIYFFMHHLCLGFICIALFSISILQFCSHISHCFHT